MTVANAENSSQTEKSPDASGAGGISLTIFVDASGKARDASPVKFRCERDDGSPGHLALLVEMPLSAASMARVAKLKCGCGGAMGLVVGERAPQLSELAAQLIVPGAAATVTGG